MTPPPPTRPRDTKRSLDAAGRLPPGYAGSTHRSWWRRLTLVHREVRIASGRSLGRRPGHNVQIWGSPSHLPPAATPPTPSSVRRMVGRLFFAQTAHGLQTRATAFRMPRTAECPQAKPYLTASPSAGHTLPARRPSCGRATASLPPTSLTTATRSRRCCRIAAQAEATGRAFLLSRPSPQPRPALPAQRHEAAAGGPADDRAAGLSGMSRVHRSS